MADRPAPGSAERLNVRERCGAPAGVAVVETSIGWNWIGPDRILWCVIKPGAMVDLEAARESVSVGQAMVREGKYVQVIDTGSMRELTRETREVFGSTEPGRRLGVGVAIIVRSPVTRVMGNFFLGFNRPATPVRLFSSRDDAVTWLHRLLDEATGP